MTAGTLFAYRGLTSRPGRPLSAALAGLAGVPGRREGDPQPRAHAAVLNRSPVPRRRLPRLPECAPDVLSRQEQTTLVALPGDYGRVLRLLLGTGIRWASWSEPERPTFKAASS
ncbi:MAG: hypothetical protein AUI36_04490 [Cyanobacteria bacterium 13_1_40CM_2_61_4]|nr:MAG: hypothetical protein AUI36_04490 [Cyanobacteria bacterium 13_1_40CM_2_61_4]